MHWHIVYGPASGHCRIGEAVSGEAGGKMPALARSMLATWGTSKGILESESIQLMIPMRNAMYAN